MTEQKLWDVEIRVADDPAKSRLFCTVTNIEDALERARVAALIPFDLQESAIFIRLSPRSTP